MRVSVFLTQIPSRARARIKIRSIKIRYDLRSDLRSYLRSDHKERKKERKKVSDSSHTDHTETKRYNLERRSAVALAF